MVGDQGDTLREDAPWHETCEATLLLELEEPSGRACCTVAVNRRLTNVCSWWGKALRLPISRESAPSYCFCTKSWGHKWRIWRIGYCLFDRRVFHHKSSSARAFRRYMRLATARHHYHMWDCARNVKRLELVMQHKNPFPAQDSESAAETQHANIAETERQRPVTRACRLSAGHVSNV